MKLPGWPDIDASRDKEPEPLTVRILWMAGIWAASVLVLLAIAVLLRLALRAG